MPENVLILIKPDGMKKALVGPVLTKFIDTGLELTAIRLATLCRNVVEEHYEHLKDQPFYSQTIDYLSGKIHNIEKVIVFILRGKNAVEICRDIAGATNPEQADPRSIRGAYGRITTQGLFENVVHVSSDPKDADREISLWFKEKDLK